VALTDIPEELHRLYEIHEWRHASAVLTKDFSTEWREICEVLRAFRLLKTRVVVPGGSKSLIAGAIDEALTRRGWVEKQFKTAITVDERTEQSPTHKVDCFKGKVGLEIEWNNKDPFFDRDLNNFRLLFDLRALSVGVIVTRCDELQTVFNRLGKGSSYGNSTTHMSKLLPRLDGGGGGGCPVLVFGIRSALFVEDIPDAETPTLIEEFKLARKSKWSTLGPTVTRYFDSLQLRKTPTTEDDDPRRPSVAIPKPDRKDGTGTQAVVALWNDVATGNHRTSSPSLCRRTFAPLSMGSKCAAGGWTPGDARLGFHL